MLTPGVPAEARQLREFLKEAGYTESAFRSSSWLHDLPTRFAGNLPWQLDCSEAATAFNSLARLFTLGLEESASRVEPLLGGALPALISRGLLSPSPGGYRANAMLTPLDDYYIAADPLHRMYPEPAADIILWSNATTTMLERSRVPGHSRATLDLGTGCGVISIFAAADSDHVVATDLNGRSAEFVPFNAWLNGVANIETLIGDTFDPVAGRTFDRILANPPFFVAPSNDVLYCENPLELDNYCRRVVREGTAMLNDGGYLQMTFEWVQVKGQPFQDRLAEWADGTGSDVLVIQSYVGRPDAYAHQRSWREYADQPEKTTAKFNKWMAYYREKQVETIHGGILVARRRAGNNWLRIEECDINARLPFGHLIEEVFATQDVLASLASDQDLLNRRPRLSKDAALEQEFIVEKGKWAFTSLKLALKNGLPATLAVESQVADFLAGCDGSRTLEQLAAALAAGVNAPVAQVRSQCCAIVKRLAAKRFLTL